MRTMFEIQKVKKIKILTFKPENINAAPTYTELGRTDRKQKRIIRKEMPELNDMIIVMD